MLPRVELTRKEIDAKALLRQRAAVTPEFTYSEPGIFCLDGIPQIIYGRFDQDLSGALWAVSTLPLKQEVRTTEGGHIGSTKDRAKLARREGLGESQIFGFRPPTPYGANYCGPSHSTVAHPKQYSQLVKLGCLAAEKYKALCPVEFERQEQLVSGVLPEWRIAGTPFTSGIVNRNNTLRYHYDKGNIEDCMSAMIVFRKDCQGGMLSVPEFGAEFLLEDGAFFFFNGQKILHGVTPIYTGTFGYRYSVVFYALRKMMECGSPEEELKRARASKTKTQKNRV